MLGQIGTLVYIICVFRQGKNLIDWSEGVNTVKTFGTMAVDLGLYASTTVLRHWYILLWFEIVMISVGGIWTLCGDRAMSLFSGWRDSRLSQKLANGWEYVISGLKRWNIHPLKPVILLLGNLALYESFRRSKVDKLPLIEKRVEV